MSLSCFLKDSWSSINHFLSFRSIVRVVSSCLNNKEPCLIHRYPEISRSAWISLTCCMTSLCSGNVCIDQVKDISTFVGFIHSKAYNPWICLFRDPESETVNGYNPAILLEVGTKSPCWRTKFLIKPSMCSIWDPSIGARISVRISSLSSISIHWDVIASNIIRITNDSVFPGPKSIYPSFRLIYLCSPVLI